MRFPFIVSMVFLCAASLSAQTTGGPILFAPTTVAIAELQKYLNLTDSQVASLQNIQQQKVADQQQVSSQIAAKYQTLQTLLQATNPDPNAVGQTMIDIQNLQKRLAPSTEPYHTQALAVLTQPQTTLLANLNTALQLETTAYQAVNVNLLLAPATSTGCGALGAISICNAAGAAAGQTIY